MRYKDINPQKGDMFTVHKPKDYFARSYGLKEYFDSNDSITAIVLENCVKVPYPWANEIPKASLEQGKRPKRKELSKRNKKRIIVYKFVGYKLKDNIQTSLGFFVHSVHSKKITYYPKKDV